MSTNTYLNTARSGMLISVIALTALAGCGDKPLDFDLRGAKGGFSTKEAASKATTQRPEPDERGVITYPNYQVVVTQKGETLTSIAQRLNLDAGRLSKYNGIPAGLALRKGEIIALPEPLDTSSGASQSSQVSTKPLSSPSVDVTTLAGNAIEKAPQTKRTPPRNTTPRVTKPKTTEPIRHQVGRGETVYTVARLYQVSVKSLAQWNGLGSDLAVREGQYLLIPVARQAPPDNPRSVSAPGQGSQTPLPPSAARPLPNDVTPIKQSVSNTPVADVGQQSAGKTTRMTLPINGPIIREYIKGKNEGINISGSDGQNVKAAAAGTVAAITKSSEGIPIIVIRHPDNLMTVYANVADVKVKKGDRVNRGQAVATLRRGNEAYLHFEVRDGFDSIDPMPYLR